MGKLQEDRIKDLVVDDDGGPLDGDADTRENDSSVCEGDDTRMGMGSGEPRVVLLLNATRVRLVSEFLGSSDWASCRRWWTRGQW